MSDAAFFAQFFERSSEGEERVNVVGGDVDVFGDVGRAGVAGGAEQSGPAR